MEWSNKIGVFTKTQGTKQQAIQKTPLVFMIYLPLIKSGPGENRTPVPTVKRWYLDRLTNRTGVVFTF